MWACGGSLIVHTGWCGPVRAGLSARRFSWIFCVGVVSSIFCLVVGAGLIWVSVPLFFVLAHGDFVECTKGGLLCAWEGYRVLAWGVGARLLRVVLCRPSDGGWGALCRHGVFGGCCVDAALFWLVRIVLCARGFLCVCAGLFLCGLDLGVLFWL